MDKDYEYGKANMLQSLENAKTYCSYMGNYDNELRWKLTDAIEFFKHSVELTLNEYEDGKIQC